jgi:dipeptidyl aminopeptidase/acylaminoacyl peptidase
MKWSCACAVAAMWLLQQQSGIAVQSTFGPTDVRPVAVPAFDAERGLQWSSSREEYDAARADERYVFEQFTYESDGLTVGAYLYRPRRRAARPLPVIVYNRGSFTRPSGFAGEMLVMANRYRDGIIERRSAIRWADRIHTPVLIMHGTADQDMPVEHSQRVATELSRLGRTHRLFLFEGQQHRIGGRGAERDASAIEWFRRFGGG